MSQEHIIRLRGLPWSCTTEDIINFLHGVHILEAENAIHLIQNHDGKLTGEAFVLLESSDDLDSALKYNKQHIGKRYIEVYTAQRNEMNVVVNKSNKRGIYPDSQPSSTCLVKMRGLPFGCSKEEIANFFGGLMIARNGITILKDSQGRASGDAYVEFTSGDMVERAMEKNKESIGHRYIELFECDSWTRDQAVNLNLRSNDGDRPRGRPSPYERQRFDRGNDRPYENERRRYDDYDRGSFARETFHYDRPMGGSSFNDRDYDRGYAPRHDDYGSRRDSGDRNGFSGGRGGFNGGYNDRGRDYGGRDANNSGMRKPYQSNNRGGNKASPKRQYTYNSQTGFNIHMRGLPYNANDHDICEFFHPLRPTNIVKHMNSEGRSAGEADVDFYTEADAKLALERDRESMQHRYVELFYFGPQGNQKYNEEEEFTNNGDYNSNRLY